MTHASTLSDAGQTVGRPFLRATAVSLLLWVGVQPAVAKPTASNGPTLINAESIDATMISLMEKYSCPGAQLAVSYHGRLLLTRGYGLADPATATPVQPESRFRIASLSKLITAAALLTLVQEGKLNLDAKAFALLPRLQPLPQATVDPRLASITVRQLLQHTGGWDRDISGDPMFKSREIAKATDTPAPASSEAIIRYMLGQRLDFDPGTKYAYSNFGYNVLGRIIEAVSGQPYAAFVQARLFSPVGITRFVQGHSRAEERLPGEVRYVPYLGLAPQRSVVSPGGESVAPPYGGFYLEAMDSHGAWVASASDYVRFVAALDGTRPPALLNAASVKLLTSRPAAPVSVDAPAYYGFGIQVRPVNGASGTGANWWHGGSLPGTFTHQVRLASGWTWAAFFNSRPKDSRPLTSDIDKSINAALGKIHPPAQGDLFEHPAAAP